MFPVRCWLQADRTRA